MRSQLNIKNGILLFITLAAFVSLLFIKAIPQDTNYHVFADRRCLALIPNFWNVVSNIPFLMIGLTGMLFVIQKKQNELWINSLVFFIGIFLTGIGSGYYHWNPANETLVWDRLPMTISFMAFFSVIIGEFISMESGKRILLPLLLTGFMSVVYWQMTESRGHGDLRFYVLVQFLPMFLIPAILLMYKSRQAPKKYFWLMILTYAIAKVFEAQDDFVFNSTHLVSGHSIKHIIAALAPLIFVLALYKGTK